MSKASKKETGRSLRHAVVECQELRVALMDCYRKEKRYQNIVNIELKQLWREVLSATNGLPPQAIANSQASIEFNQRLHATLQAMQLLSMGEPAGWAYAFLLADVRRAGESNAAGISDPAISPVLPIDQAQISIELAPDGASIELVSAEHGATEYDRQNRMIEAEGQYNFDRWDTLREEVNALLDIWIEKQRKAWKSRPEFNYRNETHDGETLKTREAKETHELFDFLYHQTPHNQNTRKRLKRLCLKIGLDLPRQGE
jgi:hypothetical protein